MPVLFFFFFFFSLDLNRSNYPFKISFLINLVTFFPPSKLFIFIFIPSLQAASTRRRASPMRNVFGVSFSRLVTGPRSNQRGSSSNYLPIRHPTKNHGSTQRFIVEYMYVCYFEGKSVCYTIPAIPYVSPTNSPSYFIIIWNNEEAYSAKCYKL